MGFSGGGSNVTKAHTHSSSIVQDGGALNFSNVTQAGMSAGDITYSNGTALQILGIGSASDALVVNGGATAPEWVTPTPAGASLWTLVDYIGGNTQTMEVTGIDAAQGDVSQVYCVYSGATNGSHDIIATVNGLSAYQYQSVMYENGNQTIDDQSGGATSVLLNTSAGLLKSDESFTGWFKINMSTGNAGDVLLGDWMLNAMDGFVSGGWSENTGSVTSIASFKMDTGSGHKFETGSYLAVYKLSNL